MKRVFSNILYDMLNTILVLAACLILGGFYWAAYEFKSYACEARWQGTYETEYHLFSGCRVKVDGKFLPEANVRAVQ